MITWTSTVLSSDVCQLCGENFKAVESQWCLSCERELFTASVDQAARSDGKLLEWKYKRRRSAATFWSLMLGFAVGTLVITLLWWVSGVMR